ncbi:hypothetical protein [uncultured Sphingomonas sp.]|uniref:hypothetical protein n=1 Tax=uncultured Sphingomonas sp. TaxID=158754 RepID=UPI0025F17320|nr:hypothetical protein [uncultured Sphingomonas sp.]
MATIAHPQQPNLRAFIVYDHVPASFAAYPVKDDANAPYLCAGDVAIIDPSDREPAPGELFVIDWQSGASAIVETWSQNMKVGCGLAGEMIDTVCWKVARANRARSADDVLCRLRSGQSVGWVDGPYPTEGPHAGALNRKLRGKVVGILQAADAEPLRQIGSAA